MSPGFFDALRKEDVKDILKEERDFTAYGFNLLEKEAIQRLEVLQERASEADSESSQAFFG